ncbi:GGDEF domain-containing protein [Glutamicibacter sp. 0426]|uniref:GGDEF domain-containing protein n=1 Tax=Glutamicibacter sp. 0426 TaxID=1913445 RepID=UPI0009F98F40|nr:GGDEF domain-containing protein [Glutamicibacter sp. 0426]
MTRIAKDAQLFNGAQIFTDSAEHAISYLKRHTPLTDWSVSRVIDGEQVHLHVQQGQLLKTGQRVEWEESLCSRMARGAAHVVENTQLDPDYSRMRSSAKVGAYAGYTINDDRDEMFGVLCGVRTDPLTEGEIIDEDLVALISSLLSAQLKLARVADRERRNSELSDALAQTDALTGLLNRRGWDKITNDAQERLDAFGDSVSVAVIDLNGLKQVNDSQGHAAGDLLLQRTGEILRGKSTESCRVARYGGDEFMILANGVAPSQTEAYFSVFKEALEEARIPAAMGFYSAQPGSTNIDQCIAAADALMYEQKYQRRVRSNNNS